MATAGPRTCIPERSTAERNIAALAFLASLVYLYLFRRYTAMEPDEGIILQGAERILHGQTIYRDFFSFYTPGSYYLTAAAFRLLGDSLAIARTVLAAGASLVSVLTYLVARRVCSRRSALGAAALTTFTALPYRDLVLHNWDSTLWAMLALYCSVRYLEAQTPRLAFTLGSLTAATVLFEQSKGVGLALGLGLAFAAQMIVARRTGVCEPDSRGGTARDKARYSSFLLGLPGYLPAMTAGFILPFLLVFAWFAHQHALGAMLTDLLWPLRHYSQANRVPYGYQNWSDAARSTLFGSPHWGVRMLALMVVAPCFVVPLLPLVAGSVYAWLSYRAWRMGPGEGSTGLAGRTPHYLLVSGIVTGLSVSVLVVRPDIIHLMYLAPMLYLVLAWILDGHRLTSALARTLLPPARIVIVACFGLFAVALALRGLGARVPIETRRGVVMAAAPDQVLSALQSAVPAGSTILVYPYLPLYYYLSATAAPGPYDYLQPGMHTLEQTTDTLNRLRTGTTAAVLYEYEFDEKIPSSWPNTPVETIAHDPAGDYLLTHFRSCAVLKSSAGWRFAFMVPRDRACPRGLP